MSWKVWLDLPAESTNTVVSNSKIPGAPILKNGVKMASRSTAMVVKGTTNRLMHSSRHALMSLADPDECDHEHIDTSGIEPVCDDCGIQIQPILKDDSGAKGESRCFHHNSNPRDITADLRGLRIPEAVQQLAKTYFLKIINFDEDTSKGDTRRKTRRRAMIAACVGQSYMDMGVPKSQKDLAEMFSISVSDLNKKGVKAISHVITTPMGRKSVSPMNFVPNMLKNLDYLNLGPSAIVQIEKLWKYISSLSGQKDYDFDSRRPKSMAAALIYFYTRLKLSKVGNNDKFDLVKFGIAVDVSTNTFQTIAQSIAPTIIGAENLTL